MARVLQENHTISAGSHLHECFKSLWIVECNVFYTAGTHSPVYILTRVFSELKCILIYFWHIMRQILQSPLTALTLVSIPSLTSLSQSKQITQCAHEDDFGGRKFCW